MLLLVAVQGFWAVVTAVKYDVMANYLGGDCNNTEPYIVYARQNGGCEDGVCYDFDVGERASTDCSKEDYLQVMRDFFGEAPYIIHSLYSDDDCSTFEYAVGFLATNSCLGGNVTAGLFYQSSLNADGSAAVVPYYVPAGSKRSMAGDSSCSSTNVAIGAVSKDEVENHSCVLLGNVSAVYDFFTTDSVNSVSSYEWYTSNDVDRSSSSGSQDEHSQSNSSSSGSITTESRSNSGDTATVVGIVVAAVIVAVGILCALICRRTKGKYTEDRSNTSSTGPNDTAMEGRRGLWNDEIITAKRIPRDKVKIKKLIRRGAYGEVYSGVYNQQKVAIKMLLPSARSNLQHVNAFLAEAKIAAAMDHPRIVSFVGVAWDSLFDLCMAIEFMDGGPPFTTQPPSKERSTRSQFTL